MREPQKPYEIMTLTEAARYIRVSEKTLGERARLGRIPCQKVGREWRFLRQALREWLSAKRECRGNLILDSDSQKQRNNLVRERPLHYGFRFNNECGPLGDRELKTRGCLSAELHECLVIQASSALSSLSKPVVEAIMRDYENNHK